MYIYILYYIYMYIYIYILYYILCILYIYIIYIYIYINIWIKKPIMDEIWTRKTNHEMMDEMITYDELWWSLDEFFFQTKEWKITTHAMDWTWGIWRGLLLNAHPSSGGQHQSAYWTDHQCRESVKPSTQKRFLDHNPKLGWKSSMRKWIDVLTVSKHLDDRHRWMVRALRQVYWYWRGLGLRCIAIDTFSPLPLSGMNMIPFYVWFLWCSIIF